MSQRKWILVLFLIPFLAFTTSQANPVTADAIKGDSLVKIYYHPEGQLPDEVEDLINPDAGTQTHIAVQGTGWEMQNSGAMTKTVLPYATKFRLKTGSPGFQWIHMPIPTPTYINDVPQKLFLVQFCAKTTNYIYAKPSNFRVWADTDKIYEATLVWPKSNGVQCITATMPATWYMSVGVSIGLKFTNTSTDIIMYRAWAAFVD